jgi:hypothetical protein
MSPEEIEARDRAASSSEVCPTHGSKISWNVAWEAARRYYTSDPEVTNYVKKKLGLS